MGVEGEQGNEQILETCQKVKNALQKVNEAHVAETGPEGCFRLVPGAVALEGSQGPWMSLTKRRQPGDNL